MPSKGDTVKAVRRKVKELAAKNMSVSVIRSDDATENIRIRIPPGLRLSLMANASGGLLQWFAWYALH